MKSKVTAIENQQNPMLTESDYRMQQKHRYEDSTKSNKKGRPSPQTGLITLHFKETRATGVQKDSKQAPKITNVQERR